MLKHLAREAISTINKPVARSRLRSLVARTPPPYRVHIGCAFTTLPGWINTDIGWRAKLWLDVQERWPFPNGTVSHIYADNMIEHVRMPVARRFFAEASRVLRPGGRIRLATPDVESLARLYLEGSSDAQWHLANARNSGFVANHLVDLLRIVFQECGHSSGQLWDYASLSAELETAGLVNLRRWTHGESDDEALRLLEHRTEEPGHADVELIVEASKPVPGAERRAGGG